MRCVLSYAGMRKSRDRYMVSHLTKGVGMLVRSRAGVSLSVIGERVGLTPRLRSPAAGLDEMYRACA